MGRVTAEERARLAAWLAEAAGARAVTLREAAKLSGGAIQENWGLEVEVADGPHGGLHRWVLRTDSPSGVATSLGRVQEFALLVAAHGVGVTVPRPLFLCPDRAVLGKPFYVMERVAGRAEGHILVRDPKIAEWGEAMAERLGRELARIHTIRPPRPDLGFLPMPDGPAAASRIATYRGYLDALPEAHPVLEWALRWLERHAPPAGDVVLCHSDLRTGNYMVHQGELTGILDWEFAAWSDPMEDIGWFCYRYWRFGSDAREAGGIGSREAFYRGYEAESGRDVARNQIPWWEALAAVRWGVIALQQGERHLTGGEDSLELALTGMRAAETELDALNAIDRMQQSAAA